MFSRRQTDEDLHKNERIIICAYMLEPTSFSMIFETFISPRNPHFLTLRFCDGPNSEWEKVTNIYSYLCLPHVAVASSYSLHCVVAAIDPQSLCHPLVTAKLHLSLTSVARSSLTRGLCGGSSGARDTVTSSFSASRMSSRYLRSASLSAS